MKERPILFSGEMVRAVLDGRKTQTRRIVKPQPYQSEYEPSLLSFTEKTKRRTVNRCGQVIPKGTPCHVATSVEQFASRCPYGVPGDRLWVRETWSGVQLYGGGSLVSYRADGDEPVTDDGRWTPSIHMFRWASRITLEITNVRVERLQDISERDAWAEGCEGWDDDVTGGYAGYDEFRDLWQSINGPDSWEQNPFVWVVEFRRINEQQSAA